MRNGIKNLNSKQTVKQTSGSISKNKSWKQQKLRLDNYCPNISMETIFIKTENSKTSASHKFVLNVSQRIDLRSSNKHVAVQNLSIYNTWKNIRQQDKKEKTQNNSSNVE